MNIGIANVFYYTPKGHSYVVRDMIKMLQEAGHKVHLYRTGPNPANDEFITPDTEEWEKDKFIPEESFVNWAIEKELDYCVFNEYGQWWDEDHDKVKICNELGIKPIGYLVWEKLDWNKLEHYKQYHKIIAPSGFQTKLMRKKGLYNVVHTPWGVDKEEIDSVQEPTKEEDDKVRFYFCAGSGGVDDRKNTDAVIKAFQELADPEIDLKISHLGSAIFSHKEIIAFMKYADVLINTAKWDTIGINTLEANMCGRPVLVVNAPPMNEIVMNNVNGLLVEGEETTSKNVTCPAFNVDIEDLKNKIILCKNKIVLDVLKNNARKVAEINFDWDKNKEHFLKIFK